MAQAARARAASLAAIRGAEHATVTARGAASKCPQIGLSSIFVITILRARHRKQKDDFSAAAVFKVLPVLVQATDPSAFDLSLLKGTRH